MTSAAAHYPTPGPSNRNTPANIPVQTVITPPLEPAFEDEVCIAVQYIVDRDNSTKQESAEHANLELLDPSPSRPSFVRQQRPAFRRAYQTEPSMRYRSV
jgi:hypothetical protein